MSFTKLRTTPPFRNTSVWNPNSHQRLLLTRLEYRPPARPMPLLLGEWDSRCCPKCRSGRRPDQVEFPKISRFRHQGGAHSLLEIFFGQPQTSLLTFVPHSLSSQASGLRMRSRGHHGKECASPSNFTPTYPPFLDLAIPAFNHFIFKSSFLFLSQNRNILGHPEVLMIYGPPHIYPDIP